MSNRFLDQVNDLDAGNTPLLQERLTPRGAEWFKSILKCESKSKSHYSLKQHSSKTLKGEAMTHSSAAFGAGRTGWFQPM